MYYVLEDIVNGYLKLTDDNIDGYYDCIKDEFADENNFVEYISAIEDEDNKISMIERFVQRESVVATQQGTGPNTQSPNNNDNFTTNLVTLLNSLASLPVKVTDQKLGNFLTRLCCEYEVFRYFKSNCPMQKDEFAIDLECWEQLQRNTTAHIPPEIAKLLKEKSYVPKMTRGN